MTRRATLNRQSAAMTDRDLLAHYANAIDLGDDQAAAIYEAEIEHRDCWA